METDINNNVTLYAGFGRADISPTESIPLGGFGNSRHRWSKEVLDPLYVSCIALKDSEGTLLLQFQYDNVRLHKHIFDPAYAYFKEKYNLPRECFHVTVTHSESTPETDYFDKEIIKPYNDRVIEAFQVAGDAAISDLTETTMEYGDTHTENLNFVKHCFFTDGRSLGDNHRFSSEGTIACHTTKVDDLLQVVRFRRIGACDLALLSWRAHNQFTSGFEKYWVSNDYVGAFVNTLEEKLGVKAIYQMGNAGNVNPYSYIRKEERTRDYKEHGKFLSEYVERIWEHLTKLPSEPILVGHQTFEMPLNHENEHLAEDGLAIWQEYQRTGERAKAFKDAREIGLFSPFEAAQLRLRKNLPAKEPCTVYAWSMGDLAWTMSQFESFDTNGMWVRENSPFKFTICVGFTDADGKWYLPSAYGWQYGCYEADTARFARGSGESVAAEQVSLLIQMKWGTGDGGTGDGSQT